MKPKTHKRYGMSQKKKCKTNVQRSTNLTVEIIGSADRSLHVLIFSLALSDAC